ncbi:MAG: outer membrane beta-barrel protein [Acidobacteria bacterium]|nr:outer membrane beta-barrel protein [Acidobacteriota bacterium]
MMRTLILFSLCAASVAAQSRYTRHNFTAGMGAGLPRGDLSGYFGSSFGMKVGYGDRFHQFFQADAGFDTLFGAAGVRDYLNSDWGALRIKDYQFFVPLGGRAILPLARERLLFYGGGGAAYLRYQERVRQPSNYYRIDCPVCRSRDGWGYYGLLGASVALDRHGTFRLGFATRVYRGHTAGEQLGQLGALRTRDLWVQTFGEFGVGF